MSEKLNVAKESYRETRRNIRYIKRLRRIGASNYEIAKALGIPEDSFLLTESKPNL